jgi:hypothetical protein
VDVPLNVFTPFPSEVFINLKLVIAWLCGAEPLPIIILTFALKSTSEALALVLFNVKIFPFQLHGN